MSQTEQIVIVGGGFGGLETVRHLKRANVQITLIDRRNFHLFQPLLYQVATGGLSPANIAAPLRALVRRQKNCEVLMAEVLDFDLEQKHVILADGQLNYDTLVLAAGASPSYFGHDDWEKSAPALKTVEDATAMRGRIYTAFERAEKETDPENRRALLTFVVVGGGPTGVELAGALAEISRHTLTHDFRHINPADAHIVLVEAAEHVLSHYSAELSQKAAERIRKLNIEVRTKTKLMAIHDGSIELETESGTEHLATQTVMWAAGVKANPLGLKLASAAGVECDRAGRIPVTDRLILEGHPEIFVIGDIAHCSDSDGQLLPGVAPVAIQQGKYVAKSIRARLQQQQTPAAFRYRDRGTMATIGRHAAVAQIGERQFCGTFAWILWLIVHLMQIVQLQNRLLVLIQWAWSYITFNRSARLITEQHDGISKSSETTQT